MSNATEFPLPDVRPWYNNTSDNFSSSESMPLTPTVTHLTSPTEQSNGTMSSNTTALVTLLLSSFAVNNFSDYNFTDGSIDEGRSRLLTKQQSFILNAFIGSLGVLGNGMVCFVFARVKKLRTLTNVFIINQSIVDLCTSSMFFTKKCILNKLVIPQGIVGDVICKLWDSGFVVWSLIMVSSSNLAALTLERYFAIVHPVQHRHRYTWGKAKIAILLVWLVPFAAEAVWAFANFNTNTGDCDYEWYNFTAKKISGVLYFCLEWAFPVSAMAFTYMCILVSLKRRASPKSTLAKGPSSERIMERACRNVTKTLITVSVIYLICWTPQALEYFLYSVAEILPNYSPIEDVVILLAFSNMCVNPIIYSVQFRPFREGIVKAFDCRKNKDPTRIKSGIENISMSISNEQTYVSQD
ncbi:allatostatin-A receptor-like [Ptychodera flava]|uniref:allatostatin-A receptor-like n=1 Tax=Ptychodera flava TaxID=63121 RepID=UPI00396AA29E